MLRATSTGAWLAASTAGLLSVVIPAHSEAETLDATVSMLTTALEAAHIAHEIVVVNDNSTDGSSDVLAALAARYGTLRVIDNAPTNGFGFAVRAGLDACRGDAIAIVMADGSDDPADLIKYYNKLKEGYDCVFGSRFIAGSHVVDYPIHKLILNRLANAFIQALFRQRFNDFTNAFKIYRREVIAGVQPLLSHHFNLTVELPLKAFIRGYNFAVVPISWQNRKQGISKLRIREMGSRFSLLFFTVLSRSNCPAAIINDVGVNRSLWFLSWRASCAIKTSHQKLSIHRGRINIATVTLIAIVVGLAVGRMVPRYFTLVWTSDCVWVSREAQSLGRSLTICCAPVSDGTVEQYVSGRQLYSSGRCS